MRRGGKKNYEPLDWKDYFDSGEDVKVKDGVRIILYHISPFSVRLS
jgi:hypothetical protein